jgi:hypothetical protein
MDTVSEGKRRTQYKLQLPDFSIFYILGNNRKATKDPYF